MVFDLAWRYKQSIAQQRLTQALDWIILISEVVSLARCPAAMSKIDQLAHRMVRREGCKWGSVGRLGAVL